MPTRLILAAALAAGPFAASAQTSDQHGQADGGLRIYKTANCVGCHQWTGVGGGGYGGAAANLRMTQLDHDQIVEVLRCGRPTTGMPHFQVDAYADGSCYGMKQADLTGGMAPPEPQRYLTPREISTVANYVLANLKGHGQPTYAECRNFFGPTSRVCDNYGTADERAAVDGAATKAAADAPAGTDAAAPPRHVAIETAPDANVSK